MTDHLLSISIVTPQSTAYEGQALAVSVPGSYGPFQILFNHAPIISSLDSGVVKIQDAQNAVTYFAAKEGFVEVLRNNVNIVVEELLKADLIDVEQAEREVEASRGVANASDVKHEKDKAKQELHWAEAKIRAARLYSEG